MKGNGPFEKGNELSKKEMDCSKKEIGASLLGVVGRNYCDCNLSVGARMKFAGVT